MAKILLAEDDLSLADVVSDWLVFQHHTVESVGDGSEAAYKLKVFQYDLVILDWELPHEHGPDICRRFRLDGGKAPVLMLTGRTSVVEKTAGLDAGADDYLTKPFHLDELSARVRALLRRSTGVQSNVLSLGALTLDPEKFLVTMGGVEIKLVSKEFALLEFLMRHPNHVFSADALLERVWHSEKDVGPDAIRSCMKRLRKKLGDDEKEQAMLQTFRGVGYKIVPPT
jgi:DNA-binding response OmpR family regulator